MKWINEREIQHPFHEQHPLVLVEDQCKAYCSGCGELLSGPCFTCSLCNYYLHQQCAEAPLSIPIHPLHPQDHYGFFLRQRPHPYSDKVYGCALCKEKRNMFFYQCSTCLFSLDIKCAQLSSSYSHIQDSKHDFHPHPLTFFQSLKVEVKRLFCSFCREPILDAFYICLLCPSLFILHIKCLDELPTKFNNHPSHRIHPLIPNPNPNTSNSFCNPCQKEHSGSVYSCSLCNFNINVECAWPRPILENKSLHQHPFTLFWRQDAFICDACGIQGNNLSYICSPCNLMVHRDCTKLPRIIKFSRHAHCLFHKYFLPKQDFTRQECMICFQQLKVERGSYSCVKPGCNYVVHVNCALENKDLYDVIEQESQCEEFGAATQSSIIRVIEESKDREATKIEHFGHEGHCLVLAADKTGEETNRKCDGCMMPVPTDQFYYCSESECHFCLHKTCAESPRINQHWLRQSIATLTYEDIDECDLCSRECSGFFYTIGGFDNVCIRCAKVADIIECEGHQHFLFFDFKCNDQRCNGCGRDRHWNGAFRCGKCSFALDFGCITLPHSALHKCDQHMLYLTYHDDNDYAEHDYCDICEEERNASLWYYHCSTCDTSAHPNCVLGQFPFVKDGTKLYPYFRNPHDHDLFFLKKTKGYPECSYCRKLCLEEILKCAQPTCNFIIHFECWWEY